jgi:hypothetical protein
MISYGKPKRIRRAVKVADYTAGPISVEDDSEYEPDDEGPPHIFPKEPSFSANPIIKAIQGYLWKRGLRVTLLGGETSVAETERLINKFFGAELQQQLGKLVLVALMDGNKKFVKTVEQALKESDAVFNRHREKAIAAKVLKYVFALPEPWPPNKEIRRLAELHCNNGKEFEEHQWRRLRQILLLDPQKTGRPRKHATEA